MVNTVSWKYRNDTGPLTTSYTSFDAYSIENAWRQTYESEEQVSVMMVEWQKQTITKWSNIISEGYLAWWTWYDGWSSHWGGEVLVVFQTNANADLLAYVIKSRDELWNDWGTYRYAFMWEMTDEIWNTMQGWFSTTLTVSTSSWTITISDGGQSILVNASTHAMRYGADYYDWSSNTSTEYSTLQTNWWLVDWTYTYQWINQDWTTIIDSLKVKWIVNATITHDAVNGEITMTNGQFSFTIMDKNLWATQVYQDWDTLSEANCGKYYQRGNNNWFAWTGSATTSSTLVDTTGYGPWNYYTGTDFITAQYDWSNPSNDNLWGDTTNTEVARQWPSPSGYHVPSAKERQNFVKMFNIIRPNAHSWNDLKNAFAMPFAGNRVYNTADTYGQGSYGWYWSSSPLYDLANDLNIGSDYVGADSTGSRAYGFSIRCFKNTVNANMSPNFDEEDI